MKKCLCYILAFSGAAIANAQAFDIPCDTARGRLIVSCFLNGIGPYPFLLDAGLRKPVVALEVGEFTGLPKNAEPVSAKTPAGHTRTVPVVTIVAFGVGEVPPFDTNAVMLDLSPLGAILGQPIAGVLPVHIAGFEAEIDFTRPTLRWRPLEAARLQAPAGDTLLMQLDESGMPELSLLVNMTYLRSFQIDLNCGDTLAMPEDMLREIGALREDTPRLVTDTPGGDPVSQIRLKELRLGVSPLKSPVCTVLPTGEPARIGLGALRNTQLTMNFEHGLARIETREALADHAPYYGFGLTPYLFRDGHWELAIAQNSPAAQAGIQPGDRLIAVNNATLETAGSDSLIRMLSATPDYAVTVTILRAREQQTLHLMPAPLLE